LSSATFAATRDAPDPKTESALRCMVGLGPEGCWTVFEVPTAHFYSQCTEEYVHRRLDNCPNGPLEMVEYLGTNAAGADVYRVNWMHLNTTYVISPPAPDGKIQRVRSFMGVFAAFGASLVRVTSPVNPVQTLYSRPEQGS
jgi:hypothetical protein